MRRVLRAFLVWIMVIAMPVQGMAASVMWFCGPSHERMMQGLVSEAPGGASGQAAAPGHGPDASHRGLHSHASPEPPVGLEPGADADAEGTTGPFPHHGKFSCSACAACCSALALPASFVLPEPSSPDRFVPMAPVAPVASHQPDGLDRPPRNVPA